MKLTITLAASTLLAGCTVTEEAMFAYQHRHAPLISYDEAEIFGPRQDGSLTADQGDGETDIGRVKTREPAKKRIPGTKPPRRRV